MRVFLFLFLTLFTASVHGQTGKIITIPTVKNYKDEVDTTLCFKNKQDLVKQINLPDLKTSTDTFHFRLWTDIQAIDIWTVDYKKYMGKVTNYAHRYNKELFYKGVFKIDKVFSNQIDLDSTKARQIFNIIDTLSIINIPTDEKIIGWQQGLDGEEFIIEISTPTQYLFNTYWTPRLFADTLIEAKRVQSLVDKLHNDFKIGNYYHKLKLPKGNYQYNGIKGIHIGTSNENRGAKNSIIDWF